MYNILIMLDGKTVPKNERYFGTSQDCKMFRFMPGMDDYNPNEEVEEHRMSISIAVKEYGSHESLNKTGHGGRVMYNGDINAETSQLVMRFLASEGVIKNDQGYKLN